MGMPDDAIVEVLQNRLFLYSFLGRLFAVEPDEDLVGLVADRHLADEFLLLDESGQAEGLLCACMRNSLLGDSGALKKIEGEYTRLFIGPAKLPAPPWESVYVSGEPLLFQESTLAVREAYLREGFRAAGYPHEADDHVATELNFMAALCKRALDAYESGDTELCRSTLEAQAHFLSEHLLVWIREFSDRLGAVRGISAFYPSFAALAALVCERDAEVIQELLAEI